jgi:hypothetical protein
MLFTYGGCRLVSPSYSPPIRVLRRNGQRFPTADTVRTADEELAAIAQKTFENITHGDHAYNIKITKSTDRTADERVSAGMVNAATSTLRSLTFGNDQMTRCDRVGGPGVSQNKYEYKMLCNEPTTDGDI